MNTTEKIASKQSQIVADAGVVFETMFVTFKQIVKFVHTVNSDIEQMELLRDHIVNAIQEISDVASKVAERLHSLSEVVSVSIGKFKFSEKSLLNIKGQGRPTEVHPRPLKYHFLIRK